MGEFIRRLELVPLKAEEEKELVFKVPLDEPVVTTRDGVVATIKTEYWGLGEYDVVVTFAFSDGASQMPHFIKSAISIHDARGEGVGYGLSEQVGDTIVYRLFGIGRGQKYTLKPMGRFGPDGSFSNF